MSTESMFKYISMISLFIAGGFMIYEGLSYIQMKKSNPSIPDTLYAAATLAIVLGVCEIAFGVYHFFIKSSP